MTAPPPPAKTKGKPRGPRVDQTPRPVPPSEGQARRLKAVDIPLNQVQELASLGLTIEQIGYFFGLHPWSVELYRRQRPELNEAIERGRSMGLEHAAAALRRQINSGNVIATIFYLKSRGKWREVSHMEVTGKDGEPIKFESKTDKIDLTKLGEQELMSILALLNKATSPRLESSTPEDAGNSDSADSADSADNAVEDEPGEDGDA